MYSFKSLESLLQTMTVLKGSMSSILKLQNQESKSIAKGEWLTCMILKLETCILETRQTSFNLFKGGGYNMGHLNPDESFI